MLRLFPPRAAAYSSEVNASGASNTGGYAFWSVLPVSSDALVKVVHPYVYVDTEKGGRPFVNFGATDLCTSDESYNRCMVDALRSGCRALATLQDVVAFLARIFDVDVYEEGRDAYQIFVSIMRMANVTAEIEYGSSGGLIFKLLIVFGKIVATPRDLIGCATEAATRAMVVNSNSPTMVYSGFFTKHMKKVTLPVKENPKTGQLGLDLVVGEHKDDLGQPSLFEGIGDSESLVKKVLGALPGNCRIIVALDNTFVFNAREIKRVVKEKLNAGVTSIAFVFAKSSAYMGVYMDYHNRVPTEKINELEFASL